MTATRVSRPLRRVAIRVDASPQIGTGHFMRCLALADAIRRRGGEIEFISRHMPEHLRRALTAHRHGFHPLGHARAGECAGGEYSKWLGTTEKADADETLARLTERKPDLLIVDHYALGSQWEAAVRSSVGRVLVIDDLANRAHECDFLLDQNVCDGADERYRGKVPGGCQLLLGPRYALLRGRFRTLRERVGERHGPIRRVLVFLGGVDSGNYTGMAIKALSSVAGSDLAADIVIGELHPGRREIEVACVSAGYACHIETDRMAELMAAADLAIGSGGSATWERCCLGLPTVTLCVADNQRRLVDEAALCGLVYAPQVAPEDAATLARHLQSLMENPLLLRAMSRNGLRMVDGRGRERVVRALGYSDVRVRDATPADSANILSWRNEPDVRLVSIDSRAIDQATHDAWFASVMADPDRMLLIGERGQRQVGVVRFDVREDEARVSIFLAPGLAGTGMGSDLLAAGEEGLAERRRNVKVVLADVKGGNLASRRLFEAAGYELRSALYVKRLRTP